MLKSALFLAFFVCYAFSNTIAKNEITMFDGTSCQTIHTGCYECAGKYVTVFSNSDSSVSYIPPTLSCYNGTDVPAVHGSCSKTGFQPCTVFYNTYYQLNTLKVSSEYPVEFFLGLCPSPIGGKVSMYGGVLEGAISQVFVSSGNETIHFIQQISQTEYVTSWGVINIGQEYTIGPVTFTFDSKTFTSMPPYLPPVPQRGVSATFNPFGGVFVYDNTKSQKFVYNDLNMALFASNEQSGFRGVELTNAFFGVKDVQLYPPYSDNDEGVWIFRFTNSFAGSGYHALPAEMSESGEYRFYECEIGDLSFSFSLGLSWSISIDLGNLPRAQTADSMAFELF